MTAQYLRPNDAAKYLSISRATLYRWMRINPDFPKSIKLGDRTAVWSIEDLANFVKLQKLSAA